MASAEFVIDVQQVGKSYRIWNSPSGRIKTFGLNALARSLPVRTPWGDRLGNQARSHYRDFMALRDITFRVRRGEAIGVIGRNGSGKSTLLQIIAGTLHPTLGQVRVQGRIAALLELGSAFHPEFTGRENVYLYCAILGIDAARVDELFDDIAAFADIGEFIGQPVKTYSSGMLLRLAFSVHTAISPDILIVDEALAVGDVFFQAKCMRRIRAMIDGGTTLLFVSHAMSTVREVCQRSLLLDGGRLVLDAPSGLATQRYLALQLGSQAAAGSANNGEATARMTEGPTAAAEIRAAERAVETERRAGASGAPAVAAFAGPPLELGQALFVKKAAAERIQNGKARFINVQLLDAGGRPSDAFEFGETAVCRMVVEITLPVANLWIGYHVRTKTGVDAVHGDSSLAGQLCHPFVAGRLYTADWKFTLRLQHGDYYLMCVLGIPDPPGAMQPRWEYVDVVNHAYDFSVAPRRQGMIGGLVAWNDELTIREQA